MCWPQGVFEGQATCVAASEGGVSAPGSSGIYLNRGCETRIPGAVQVVGLRDASVMRYVLGFPGDRTGCAPQSSRHDRRALDPRSERSTTELHRLQDVPSKQAGASELAQAATIRAGTCARRHGPFALGALRVASGLIAQDSCPGAGRRGLHHAFALEKRTAASTVGIPTPGSPRSVVAWPLWRSSQPPLSRGSEGRRA